MALISPLIFSRKIIEIRPFWYQARILLEAQYRKRIIVLAGRQIGKTYILAVIALWWAFTKPNQTVLIVAPTMRQSKIPYERLRAMVDGIPFLHKKRTKDTLTETKFSNGSVIHCLPAGRLGLFLTGFPADLVIFDEAAFIPQKVFNALRPSIAARDGTMILSGTPYAEEGEFHDVFTNEPSKREKYRYVKFRIPSIMSPLIDEDFLEEEREHMTAAEFRMWYEGEFIQEVDEFFPKVLIKKCLRDYDYVKLDEIGEIAPGDRIVGVDVARFGLDETAGVVIERIKDKSLHKCKKREKVYKVIYVETIAKTSGPEAADFGRRLFEDFKAKKIIVDATGLGGAGAYDILAMDYSPLILEGVELHGPIREAMYNILRMAIERENLILNKDDLKMLKQFGSFSLAKSDSATAKLMIKKNPLAHDDLPDALAMALWGYEGSTRWEPMDPRKTVDGEYTETDKSKKLKTSLMEDDGYGPVDMTTDPVLKEIRAIREQNKEQKKKDEDEMEEWEEELKRRKEHRDDRRLKNKLDDDDKDEYDEDGKKKKKKKIGGDMWGLIDAPI